MLLYSHKGDNMSYKEYNDLMLKCQENGGYRVFTIDIKNSKLLPNREEAIYNLITLIERTYQDILALGKELNKPILIDDEGYKSILDEQNLKNEGQMPYDWFIYGDAVGITIHNNSIPARIIYEILELNIKEMGLTDNFHKNDLVYETDKYFEGHDKYFRGYAIQMSANMHKDGTPNITKEELSPEEINKYMEIINKNHKDAIERANERISNFKNHNKSRKK